MKYSLMTTEQKKAYKLRVKAYRIAHPDKVAKWTKDYRQTEKYKEYSRKQARKNKLLHPERTLDIALKSSRKRLLPAPTRPCPDRCELCGGLPDGRVLNLDHDHKTGEFRGWLCKKCNLNLGKFGDGVAGLQQAILYLKRNSKSLLPTDAAERKKIPLSSGVLDYFPAALVEVAKVSYMGNQQHNAGQPLHWSRGKSADHSDTLQRHLAERGSIDTDGMRHSAKAAWRCLAILQLEMEEAGAPLARGAK
jgi:hypothetical protein